MTDPRYKPGGRWHYGTRAERLAELRAAGVTKNDAGPIEAQPFPVLSGMVERVRQRAGFLAAKWRRSPRLTPKPGLRCSICGSSVDCMERYYVGAGRAAHSYCVETWRDQNG